MKEYRDVINADEQLIRRMYLITLVFALFFASFTIKGGLESGKYIVNRRGAVVGIERRSLSSYEEYPLRVIISNSGDEIEKDVVVSKQAIKENPKAEESETTKENQQSREAELDQLILEIEASS